jgi:hypothetical protein
MRKDGKAAGDGIDAPRRLQYPATLQRSDQPPAPSRMLQRAGSPRPEIFFTISTQSVPELCQSSLTMGRVAVWR